MSSNSYDPARNEYFEQFQGSHQGIARIFSVNSDSCGNPAHFTEYLLCNAMSDSLTGMGVTHVLAQHDDEVILLSTKPIRLNPKITNNDF